MFPNDDNVDIVARSKAVGEPPLDARPLRLDRREACPVLRLPSRLRRTHIARHRRRNHALPDLGQTPAQTRRCRKRQRQRRDRPSRREGAVITAVSDVPVQRRPPGRSRTKPGQIRSFSVVDFP